jgi:hypothetical protein
MLGFIWQISGGSTTAHASCRSQLAGDVFTYSRRVDDALSIHQIAVVDEKGVIHPTGPQAL